MLEWLLINLVNEDNLINFEFEDWGLIDYQEALKKQEDLVEEVKSGNQKNTIIFCSHHPIVTCGRNTQSDDVFSWKGKSLQVSRGGRATYHGPSQIVIYPIISIKEPRKKSGPNDVGFFLRDFENAIVKTLADFGINAQGKSFQENPKIGLVKEETGVWVKDKKIASLGLSVRHWITYHGAAINFSKDETAFQGINPCGFSSSVMTSVEEVLGLLPDRNYFLEKLKLELCEELT
jgi:lipoyl(octanoyl) transferase